jgi:hypothetical protein
VSRACVSAVAYSTSCDQKRDAPQTALTAPSELRSMHLQEGGRPRVSCWFPTRRAVMARDACARNLDETLDGIAREAYETGQEVSSRGSVSVRAVWHAPRECSIWTVGATRSVLGKLEARGAARTYTDLGRLQDHLRRASETCREASRSLSRRKADKVSARPTLG